MLFPPPRPASLARVVVTGAGVVTALGLDWDSNAAGFRVGRPAFQPVTLFDVSRQRVKHAAQVTLPEDFAALGLSGRKWRRVDRASRLALAAASQAWAQAGFQPGPIPVVLGTTSGGMALGQDYYSQAIRSPSRKRRQPSRVSHYVAPRQGLDLADAFKITGPVVIIANACASGANALGHAWDIVRRRQASQVLAGGYDALSQLVFSGFDSLQALSPTRCRPFDAHRDGLALGEGAAVLALESLDSAQRRGARILGEIAGYGAATDSHHLTQPHPDGCAALQAMEGACQSAGVAPAEIDYVNAHGTGTLLNDASETAAINRWAGERAPRLKVSSTKAAVGHLLGAAGAVEAAICLMALQGRWFPPTPAVTDPEPSARFQIVRAPADGEFEFALSNSFGFGGANASLLLRRWHV